MSNVEQIEEIREKLKKAKNVAILTGAGISQESGVPTFRGEEGLWKNYRAEELATPEAFETDPALVWQWYDWRRSLIKPLLPNPAHDALAELEKSLHKRGENFTLITQNIDGLHEKAGSKNIVELHGNIWKVRCTKCQQVTENSQVPIEILPKCTKCGALLRPHVVWFGEALETDILTKAFKASEECDLFFVIGTSSVVQPAASLAIRAKEANAFVVEINMEETPITEYTDYSLIGKAGEIMPKFL